MRKLFLGLLVAASPALRQRPAGKTLCSRTDALNLTSFFWVQAQRGSVAQDHIAQQGPNKVQMPGPHPTSPRLSVAHVSLQHQLAMRDRQWEPFN